MTTKTPLLLIPATVQNAGNYLKWLAEVIDDFGELHGAVATVPLQTGIEFLPPRITVADYNPEIVAVEGEDPEPAQSPAITAAR